MSSLSAADDEDLFRGLDAIADALRCQEREDARMRELRAAGHVCMLTQDSFPMSVMWCGQTPCTGPPFVFDSKT
jgi:hypothetical protein